MYKKGGRKMIKFEMVDKKIHKGYTLLKKRKINEACSIWWDAWNDIVNLMDQQSLSGINAFDKKFEGSQSIFNWGSDFEMELHNAGLYDESFIQMKIDFCKEYIKRTEDKKQINIQQMKVSIAESYIKMGKQNEGEALFESYLIDDPQWGWGWIAYSDCYRIFSGDKQNDPKKAEAILKRALAVEGLEDREDALEMLIEFYNETNREDDASAIKRQLDELIESNDCEKNNIQSISNTKVGRNEPCPCGSDKKYKKCCGK